MSAAGAGFRVCSLFPKHGDGAGDGDDGHEAHRCRWERPRGGDQAPDATRSAGLTFPTRPAPQPLAAPGRLLLLDLSENPS